ncbi:hypothetical protein KGY64_06075, partial [Candidatus Bipolaricaulota bacterium]|nr:hypothetical protein [Candidatus Bipolaricaulota bacterium]
MVDANQPTAIGRPLDPSYPSNLFIMIFSGAGLVGFALSEFLLSGGALDSLAFGVRAGLGIFLTWALGRELDPDNPATATVSSVGIVVPIALWGTPGLLIAAWSLFILRVLNRTTGLKANLGDTLFITVLSGLLGYFISPAIAAASFFVFIADGVASNPNRRHLLTGSLLGIEGLILWLVDPPGIPGYLTSAPVLVTVFTVGLAYLWTILLGRDLESRGDNSGELLDPV